MSLFFIVMSNLQKISCTNYWVYSETHHNRRIKQKWLQIVWKLSLFIIFQLYPSWVCIQLLLTLFRKGVFLISSWIAQYSICKTARNRQSRVRINLTVFPGFLTFLALFIFANATAKLCCFILPIKIKKNMKSENDWWMYTVQYRKSAAKTSCWKLPHKKT